MVLTNMWPRMADRKARLKSKIYSRFNCLLLLWLLLAGESVLRAAPVLDTTTPLNFFTNTANLFLQNAGYNFTVSNIPIYPTNYYTPALHRLLQLAAAFSAKNAALAGEL